MEADLSPTIKITSDKPKHHDWIPEEIKKSYNNKSRLLHKWLKAETKKTGDPQITSAVCKSNFTQAELRPHVMLTYINTV